MCPGSRRTLILGRRASRHGNPNICRFCSQKRPAAKGRKGGRGRWKGADPQEVGHRGVRVACGDGQIRRRGKRRREAASQSAQDKRGEAAPTESSSRCECRHRQRRGSQSAPRHKIAWLSGITAHNLPVLDHARVKFRQGRPDFQLWIAPLYSLKWNSMVHEGKVKVPRTTGRYSNSRCAHRVTGSGGGSG